MLNIMLILSPPEERRFYSVAPKSNLDPKHVSRSMFMLIYKAGSISLLRAMVMQMTPITIRNRLNRANMAAATFRSAQKKNKRRTEESPGRLNTC